MASSPQSVSGICNSQQSRPDDAQDPFDLGNFESFCDLITSSSTSSGTLQAPDDADFLLRDGINFADELRSRHGNYQNRFPTLLAMIRALRRKGKEAELSARLNTPDSRNSLLLHQALSSSRTDEFILLLANGADPNQKSADNETAWSIVNSRLTHHRIELPMFLSMQMMHLMDFCAKNKSSRLSIDIGLTHKTSTGTETEIKSHILTYGELLGHLSRWEPLSDPSAHPFYRIHVSSTNGALLMIIFSLLDRNPREHARRWDFDSQALVSYFLKSFAWSQVVCENKYLAHRDPSYLPESAVRGHGLTSIVFPCLVLDEVWRWTKRKEKFTQLIDEMDKRRNDAEICEERMMHLEQTLDEAYYPGLTINDHTLRNEDQVVTKEFGRTHFKSNGIRPEGSGSRESRHEDTRPILLVPQLWIWKSQKNVVSAYSFPRQAYGYYTIGEPSLLKPQNADRDANLFIGSMLQSHIEGFGRIYKRGSIKFPPALDLFEQHVVSVVTEVSTYVNESHPSKMNFHTEKKLLHRLADVQEELAMVKHVIDQQEEIFNEFLTNVGIENDASKDGSIKKKAGIDTIKVATDAEKAGSDVTIAQERWVRVVTASSTLARYKKRIEKIKNDSERIEKAVKDKLELKRTYASVKATRSGLILSLAAVAFAVVTVFFAPLAFLPALFALRMEGFPKLYVDSESKGDDIVYKSDKMGGIFASSEVLTIAITLVFVCLAKQWLDHQDKIDKEECENGNNKPQTASAAVVAALSTTTSPSNIAPGPTANSLSTAVPRPTSAPLAKSSSSPTGNSTSRTSSNSAAASVRAATVDLASATKSAPAVNSAPSAARPRKDDAQVETSRSRKKASDDIEAQQGAAAAT